METGLKNDYSVLLPVFPFPNPESVSASSAEMDKAIKKSFKLITLHSITAKPEYSKGIRSASEKEFYNKKEYNKWIDDAYLMIGKASLMKNDLFMSNNAFRQIIKEYPGENTEIEAKIWLVRNLLLKEEYLEAGEMLEKLETEENMPRRLKSFYRATYADFYLHKKKIPEAIEQLELAVKARNDKKTLLRYTFLLGQLYQRTGNFNNASEKYLKVIKMSPPYEMAFNAQINMAGTYDANNRNAAEIRKRLNKLLKDSKNKEFQDQIYYALANINIKENEVDEAIKNYKLSIRKSVSNAKQKARSYFAIAEIKYENKNYLLAQAYYDSTVVNIDETFPDYQRISLRSRNLKRLVDNLNMVSFEDSVQFIAKMSESERNTFIDNIIAKLKEKEAEDQRVKQEEMLEMQNNVNLLNDLNNNSSQTADGNKWYFYNELVYKRQFQVFQHYQSQKQQFHSCWEKKQNLLPVLLAVAQMHRTLILGIDRFFH